MNVQVIRRHELPLSNIAHELVGADQGGVGVCILFVDPPPGSGSSLHKHPHEDVFITLAGEATLVGGGDEVVTRAGDK